MKIPNSWNYVGNELIIKNDNGLYIFNLKNSVST